METPAAPPPKNKPGRPQGAVGKLAREARERAAATGDLPHEILLRMARGEVMRQDTVDPVTGEVKIGHHIADFEQRRAAAQAAAPYFAPKISTVEVIAGVNDEQLDEIIARAAAEAGVSVGLDGEGEEDEAPEPVAGGPRPRKRVVQANPPT